MLLPFQGWLFFIVRVRPFLSTFIALCSIYLTEQIASVLRERSLNPTCSQTELGSLICCIKKNIPEEASRGKLLSLKFPTLLRLGLLCRLYYQLGANNVQDSLFASRVILGICSFHVGISHRSFVLNS